MSKPKLKHWIKWKIIRSWESNPTPITKTTSEQRGNKAKNTIHFNRAQYLILILRLCIRDRCRRSWISRSDSNNRFNRRGHKKLLRNQVANHYIMAIIITKSRWPLLILARTNRRRWGWDKIYYLRITMTFCRHHTILAIQMTHNVILVFHHQILLWLNIQISRLMKASILINLKMKYN